MLSQTSALTRVRRSTAMTVPSSMAKKMEIEEISSVRRNPSQSMCPYSPDTTNPQSNEYLHDLTRW